EGYGMTRIETRDYACGVIEAIREPTPGMVAAFWRPVHDNGHGIFDGDHVFAAAWASAIDAALSTGSGIERGRSAQYRDGYRRASKDCVEWLHDEAKRMNDPHAMRVLNS